MQPAVQTAPGRGPLACPANRRSACIYRKFSFPSGCPRYTGCLGGAEKVGQHHRHPQAVRVAATAQPTTSRVPVTSVVQTPKSEILWGSYVSSKPKVHQAVKEAVARISAGLPPAFAPSFALVFASCSYGKDLENVVKEIRQQVPSVRHIFGCSSYGVLGTGDGGAEDVEGLPGLSLSLGSLPGVELSLVHVLRSAVPSEDASPGSWSELVGIPLTGSSSSSSSSSSPLPGAAAANPDGDADGDEEPEAAGSAGQASLAAAPPTISSSSSSSFSSSTMGGISRPILQQEPPVSFVVLTDSCFKQARRLMAGLDFAFPAAGKVGAVLSAGLAHKRRLMFAWSAEGGVKAGGLKWQQRRDQARQQQQQRQGRGLGGCYAGAETSSPPAAAAVEEGEGEEVPGGDSGGSPRADRSSSSSSSTSGGGGGDEAAGSADQRMQQQQEVPGLASPAAAGAVEQTGKGMLGMLYSAISSFGGGDKADESNKGKASSSSSSGSGKESRGVTQTAAAGGPQAGGEEEESAANWLMDLLVAESEEEEDEAAAAAAEGEQEDAGIFMYGAAVLAMKGPVYVEPLTCQGFRTISNKVWTVGQVIMGGLAIGTLVDPDAEDEGEQSPLMAVYDLMTAMDLDIEDPAHSQVLDELSEKIAVAVAKDVLTPDSDLEPDDFQVMMVQAVTQKFGALVLDGEVRPGYRMKLVLRDKEGVQEDLNTKLLGLKRADLGATLSGRPKPPAFGALVLNDMGRGAALYEESGVEVGAVGQYLPVPLAGMFASAEVSNVNRKTALYEMACVVGVLRAQPEADLS